MKLTKIALGLSVVVSAFAVASVQNISTLGKDESQINVAQVQAQFTLKKSAQGNQSRISLVVKDLGGSTDVSPGLNLYLIFWHDGEWGNSTASFDLGSTFSLVDYTDKGDGTIVLKLKQYGERGFYIETVTIDYKQFATQFERIASSYSQNEAQNNWVQGSISRYQQDL